MILSKRQFRGFSRLFRSLTLFVADEAGIREPREGSPMFREQQRMLDAVDLIWTRAGDLAWVDRFIERNPAHFNRHDLAIVASWKNAVASAFCVTHVGDDTVFLIEDYAFVVRGVGEEIYKIVETPELCWTVLLPFDGVITYVQGLATVVNPDPGLIELADRGLGWYRDQGHVIRTERQYLKVAPLICNELRVRREDIVVGGDPAEDLAVEGDPYEVASGQHRGVLAGIWGDERDSLGLVDTRERMNQLMPLAEIARSAASSMCRPTLPIASLEDVLMTKKRDDIVKWAKWLGLVSYSHLRKAELAHWVAHFFVEDPKDILELLQQQGKLCVEGARRTFEAGGRLDVRLQDIESFVDFPQTCFPVLNGYRMGDILVAHMPDEVMEALRGVDWDTETARADRIYRAAHYLEALVSYRGIVDAGEACVLVMLDPDFKDFSPYDFETMNIHMGLSELISCTFVSMEGDSKGTYVMDPLLIRESGIDKDHTSFHGPKGSFLPEEILDAQRGIKPRSVSGLKPGDDAMGLFVNPDVNPLAKEIIGYLDERVPDGGDDYNFAERVLEGVCFEDWQHDFSISRLHTVLAMEGFNGTPAQVRHLEGLFRRMFDQMPRWRNNGWSNVEVDEHRI